MPRPNATATCKLMLTALALSLSGCAATLPPLATPCPQIPQPPELSTPQPPVSYSLSAQELIKSWREKLTGMPATVR